ncbi:unnamed protein product [Notodromas monacha]|uniref:Uncharacterized protein n=1 Tax=Notodromas monacha TaxID=399045 RepID=A0A7R9BZU2_9CRUS|nr:unnamed protein product [Notodromas monacha]CAG0923720.1 unnamed protein product [Notodromas monacha]
MVVCKRALLALAIALLAAMTAGRPNTGISSLMMRGHHQQRMRAHATQPTEAEGATVSSYQGQLGRLERSSPEIDGVGRSEFQSGSADDAPVSDKQLQEEFKLAGGVTQADAGGSDDDDDDFSDFPAAEPEADRKRKRLHSSSSSRRKDGGFEDMWGALGRRKPGNTDYIQDRQNSGAELDREPAEYFPYREFGKFQFFLFFITGKKT